MTRRLILIVTGILAAGWLTGAGLSAHEIIYQGSVLAIDAAKPPAFRIHIKAVDTKTKKEEEIWFTLDKDTKVRRGDKTVTFADAKVTRGERIVVIVEHEADGAIRVKQVRLAVSSH